jgi:hypothetical protein
MTALINKIDYFFAPYCKDLKEFKKAHMEFDQEKLSKKVDWTSISDMILRVSGNKSFGKAIMELKKIKSDSSKSKLKEHYTQNHTMDAPKPFYMHSMRQRRMRIKTKKSYARPLHEDLLAQKIFNVKFKNFQTLKSRKSVDGGRRFSKVSTHDPLQIDQLLTHVKIRESFVENSVKDRTERAKKLSSESLHPSNLDFKINVKKASSESKESIKIITNQAEKEESKIVSKNVLMSIEKCRRRKIFE